MERFQSDWSSRHKAIQNQIAYTLLNSNTILSSEMLFSAVFGSHFAGLFWFSCGYFFVVDFYLIPVDVLYCALLRFLSDFCYRCASRVTAAELCSVVDINRHLGCNTRRSFSLSIFYLFNGYCKPMTSN